MNRQTKRYLGWVLTPILLSCTALAQSPQESGAVQQKIRQMQQATAMNEQQLRSYQWIETTTLSIDGRPRPPQQSLCRYGPDGTVHKTPMQAQQAPQVSGGPLPNDIPRKKNEEFHGEVAAVHQRTAR